MSAGIDARWRLGSEWPNSSNLRLCPLQHKVRQTDRQQTKCFDFFFFFLTLSNCLQPLTTIYHITPDGE